MPLRSPVVPVDRPSGPPFDRQRGDRTRAGDRRRDGRSVPGLRSELAAGARVPLRPPHGDDREHRDESAQRRPGAFALIDADGFVARSTFLYRSAEATEADPDLQYGELALGGSISGVVGFQVLNGIESASSSA